MTIIDHATECEARAAADRSRNDEAAAQAEEAAAQHHRAAAEHRHAADSADGETIHEGDSDAAADESMATDETDGMAWTAAEIDEAIEWNAIEAAAMAANHAGYEAREETTPPTNPAEHRAVAEAHDRAARAHEAMAAAIRAMR